MKTNKTYYRNPLPNSALNDFTIEKPQLDINFPFLGSLKNRSTNEIESSNWMVGCETLDRNYANYDEYKDYLCPLGIKILRFQGGWARTEQIAGVYNWEWMDNFVEDAVKKGLRPWIQTSYGNSIYPGAGGDNLGAGMPLNEEGMAAYEKWVAAMVTRYVDKVYDWEVWNEPNFGDNEINTPEITAAFNIATAKIIKEIQPDARISALALGHINLNYVERFFKYLSEHNACDLFHDVTYHDYSYNPDANKLVVYKMRQIVEKYAPGLIMRQGENGAPSVRNAGGALFDHSWTEFSQAKWDLRRMLENLGNDIECSIFSIAEMQYTGNGPINKKNTKGLLETRPDNTVVRPKIAYYAVRNMVSIFDNTLCRIKTMHNTLNANYIKEDDCFANTDRSISIYGYENKENGYRAYTIWSDDAIPGEKDKMSHTNFAFANGKFQQPVLIELITGNVYEIPKELWSRKDNVDYFDNMPYYDSPIVITDKALVSIES